MSKLEDELRFVAGHGALRRPWIIKLAAKIKTKNPKWSLSKCLVTAKSQQPTDPTQVTEPDRILINTPTVAAIANPQKLSELLGTVSYE